VTTAPAKIIELMEKFERDQDIYRSSQYNETELRTEFINPFFEALGWDVYHKHECRADKREVKEEDAIDVEGKIKSPDYSFRLFEKRKFFVEVKRPSVNIESGVYPAYQIRRYAWSADLAISILTDFEEFSVYYCRARPSKDDKSTKSRLLYFRYDQYAEKWPEISALFSRDAVLEGSLDKYVQSLPQKRGEKRVDAALLDDISEWREMLAKSIARHNPLLDTVSLNYAVQTIIDRIIFLRICEDRGIERYLRLKDLLSGDRVYPRLCELFLQADDRYNSGIFHFGKEPGRDNPDTITPGLVIDDETLKNIIKRLYFPESPYEFSVLPAEILGQIYEQFLGKVIRLDESHNALVEDKPEVKKAGGVKYTPAYIVEYIVQNTIAPLLKEKTLQEAAALRVLDPACGSGSFLIVAYQHLLDWHKEWYIQNLVPLMESGRMSEIKRLLPAPAAPATGKRGRSREPELPIYQWRGEEWKLTTAERKRILLNSIYGVDIDRQAVEVTKLSLLLKVLEGENEETISKQLKLFAERALPDLSRNIKCGNSLIGWDILKDNPGLGPEEIARINPFDWEREFPEVFLKGGFDVVIGNPPYIRIHNLVDFYPQEVRYIQKTFPTARFGKVDIYVPFIEKAQSLLNPRGKLGFIVPDKFMRADYGIELRRFIAERKALDKVIDFGHAQVFDGVTTYTCLLFLSGGSAKEFYAGVNSYFLDPQVFLRDIIFESQPIAVLTEDTWSLSNSLESTILNKLDNLGTVLPEFAKLLVTGVKTGANRIFIFELVKNNGPTCLVKQDEGEELVELECDILFPYWKAESMKRYYQTSAHRLLLYPYRLVDGKTKLIPQTEMENTYPLTWEYLNKHKDTLESRQKGKLKGESWYGLSFASDLRMFLAQKIVTPTLATLNSFTIDSNNHFFPQGAGGGCGIVPVPEQSALYMIGILNSSLTTFYFQLISSRFQGGFFAYEPRYLTRIPIKSINNDDPVDVSRHDRMVALVEQMLALHKQLPETSTPHEKTALQRRIEATDVQIDALVYELYGLTEEEIRTVEKASK
jgi:hypothetical protein